MLKFNNKGMTLIELLAVIVMMLILLGVVFINPRPSTDLDVAARQLVTDLRRAQNMAMSAERHNDSVPDSYGIKYTNGDSKYVLCKYSPEVEIEEIDFPLKSITIDSSSNSIRFRTPDGSVDIPRDIDIKYSDGSTKRITVNSAGLIEIQ